MKQADLIGAIRLPNTAFEGTGTNVVSDILVFKKREPGTPYKGEAFAAIGYRPWEGANMWENYEINEYFVNHPEKVLGTPTYATGQYGRSTNAKSSPTRCVGELFVFFAYSSSPSGESRQSKCSWQAGQTRSRGSQVSSKQTVSPQCGQTAS